MAQAPKKRTRQPNQLPAGRHGLPRQFVAANQRERILMAVAEVCSATGYVSMSVEDIVVASGVSRRTFYDNYRGKEEAFLAAYDAVAAQLLVRVKAAYDANEGLVARVRESLRAFLDFIAEEPAYADMCVVEALAAGPKAIERRNGILHTLSQLIDETAAAELPQARRPSPIIAETLVGGISEIVYSRVLAGRHAELPDLLPDLVFTLLLPYAGRDVASEILKKERRRITQAAKVAAG